MDKQCVSILEVLLKGSFNYYELYILAKLDFGTTMEKTQHLIEKGYVYEGEIIEPHKFSITQDGINFLTEYKSNNFNQKYPHIISTLALLVSIVAIIVSIVK